MNFSLMQIYLECYGRNFFGFLNNHSLKNIFVTIKVEVYMKIDLGDRKINTRIIHIYKTSVKNNETPFYHYH